MSSTSKLYGIRRSGISHGDVFTSPRVIFFMLDLIGYTCDKDLSKYKILEPSFGDGGFLLEIQKRMIQSANIHNFDASEAFSENVYGCEIDRYKYDYTIRALKNVMPNYNAYHLKNEDFLFTKWDTEFDFIIGNPPYIRYERIPDEARTAYKDKFDTFHYRCDLYVLFYEHCLKNLAGNGRHCFICSNRWLKNEYGKKLRALISMSYNLKYIIDVERLAAFEESVLTYPSITLISNSGVCTETHLATVSNLQDLRLPVSTTTKRLSDNCDWNNLFLKDKVESLSLIEDQGFSVGIGVATGADKIFISSDLQSIIEEELLLPIINARDLTGNEFNWKGLYLLNPYKADGSLIDLEDYPKAKSYLEKNKSKLENRHIAKNGRCWYALIDKVKPQLKSQPKILLPDISGNKKIFIDDGSFYPAHNIYYITGKNKEDLEVLATILTSDFVRQQIEAISNKMNGGLPRWQSQSIKKIRIPVISKLSSDIRQELIEAYRKEHYDNINYIVNEIIDNQTEESQTKEKIKFQRSLFDFDFTDESEALHSRV